MFKKRRNKPRLLMILLLAAGGILLFFSIFGSSSGQEAKEAVNAFYQYEQAGDFSKSWELFHSDMKKQFPKGSYIQDRANVFMNHFGVETFAYTLNDAEEIKNWRMSKESAAYSSVYKVTVTQTYIGKYGRFRIGQDVFAVKEQKEWKLLWDYNETK
ncbi:hypothetical protein JOC78_002254 [Bacillus ectoiniformans]|uniref:hypothetical protein n=1 Tax=Bacillus ectoiniformans TaxID=1494429 RepID=UPI001957CF50|nr:hypothetical protein [Bacillus ectoiniformans]MBM7649301.1 hypothetical protein [Bacillus ectoiniformans]